MNTKCLNYTLTLCTFIILTLIVGCSSDSGSTAAKLNGTVATGAAGVGTLYITDTNGSTKNIVINQADDGQYSINVDGMDGPFMLGFDQSPEDAINDLFSFAESANTAANVSQLTTLTMFLANAESDLGTLFDNWADTTLTAGDITDARNKVTANLTSQLDALEGIDSSTYNFMTTVFNPNGKGIDGLLDKVVIDYSDTGTFSVSLKGDSEFSFSLDVDTSGSDTSNTSSALSGKWCMQITSITINGTTKTLPNDAPECNIDAADVPTEEEFSAFKNLISTAIGQDAVKINITRNSDTEVVITTSYDVLGYSNTTVYTYTKQ